MCNDANIWKIIRRDEIYVKYLFHIKDKYFAMRKLSKLPYALTVCALHVKRLIIICSNVLSSFQLPYCTVQFIIRRSAPVHLVDQNGKSTNHREREISHPHGDNAFRHIYLYINSSSLSHADHKCIILLNWIRNCGANKYFENSLLIGEEWMYLK